MAEPLLLMTEPPRYSSEAEARRKVCAIGRRMYRRGLVVAREGNLSVRLDIDRILVTPAGACKGELSIDDLMVIDCEGKVVSGIGHPSSEVQMHLLYYRYRPDVQAVCHAHPVAATAFATAGRALDTAVLPEVVVELGRVPLAPYGTPGTWELCANLEALVGKHDGILLANHGVVTAGPSLDVAFYRMETIEQFARILLGAEALGGPCLLSLAQIQKLTSPQSTCAKQHPRDARPAEPVYCS
jgi:L-fuculose-phosphate aldolase